MTALARKLKARGHETILFGVPDAEPAARAANLGFVSYGEREFPCGGIEQKWSQVARLQGDEVLRATRSQTYSLSSSEWDFSTCLKNPGERASKLS